MISIASDSLQPDLVELEHSAQRGGGGAEQHEDDGEAEDEERGVQQRQPPTGAHLLQREAGEEPDVGRDQRKHTGRQKAQQAGREGDQDA